VWMGKTYDTQERKSGEEGKNGGKKVNLIKGEEKKSPLRSSTKEVNSARNRRGCERSGHERKEERHGDRARIRDSPRELAIRKRMPEFSK